MYRWTVLVAGLFIAGCGSTKSPEELRDKVPGQVLSTLKNYGDTYTLIERQIRSCHGDGDQTIRSALYKDRKRGAIAVQKGETYKILIEVHKSPGGSGSQISVHSRDDELGDRVHAWIQGDRGCQSSVTVSR